MVSTVERPARLPCPRRLTHGTRRARARHPATGETPAHRPGNDGGDEATVEGIPGIVGRYGPRTEGRGTTDRVGEVTWETGGRSAHSSCSVMVWRPTSTG